MYFKEYGPNGEQVFKLSRVNSPTIASDKQENTCFDASVHLLLAAKLLCLE